MNPRRLAIGGAAALVILLLCLSSALFTVQQGQQALVLQFGRQIRTVREPGLAIKVPFLQNVEYFESRVLDFDAPSIEVVLGDQKRLVVDTFARYRISDPLRFRQTVGSELAFRGRFEPIINSNLRGILGGASLFQVLSQDRAQQMARLRETANTALSRFGVEVVDVRIKRADLPPENSQAVFRRMQTERDREAKELRAQGAEIGQRIKARADRERRVLIAEAERQSQVNRGQGDGEAIRIFAESFGQDVAFFDFYRSMQAYREALSDGQTSFVLSPKSEFFRFFDSAGPGTPGGRADRGPDLAQTPVSPLPPQPGTLPPAP